MKTITKEEAEKRVKESGGVIREDITNDLWYFVTGNSGNESEEFQKARKLGVLFINEAEFKKMID